MKTESSLVFFYNGIKDAKGAKLQGCSYNSDSRNPDSDITIYGKRYRDFSKVVHDAFRVENNTDMMTDYFENDKIRVSPSHPLYPQVKAAHDAQQARADKRMAGYVARSAARMAA